MPRHLSEKARLTTISVPAAIAKQGKEAAREAITAHVLQYLGTYRGSLWDLCIGCYIQGLLDAAQMAEHHPGWPVMIETTKDAN